MKKLAIWLVLGAAVVVLVYLVDRGVIRWQPLTVAVAALLAPLKLLTGLFSSDEDEIRERHRRKREEEEAFQRAVEVEVERRARRVEDLRGEVQQADREVRRLREQREALAEDIADESAGELAERFRNAVG